MNDDIHSLSTTIAALRAELDEVKAKLQKLDRVIIFDRDTDDGPEFASIECADLVVRQRKDPRFFAVHLGSIDSGGYINVHYPKAEDAVKTAISLAIQGDGQPHIEVIGKDFKPRADTFITGDTGASVVFSSDGKPGAIVRAREGGGSVAVLEPSGRARGLLIYDETLQSADGESAAGAELLLALPDGRTLAKLSSDGDGGMLCVASPESRDAISLVARDTGPSLMMKSPGQKSHVCVAATDDIARISAGEGAIGDPGAEAAIECGSKFGSGASFKDAHGMKRIRLEATDEVGTITILDDDEKAAIAITHQPESHSSLALAGMGGHDAFRFISGVEATVLKLSAPNEVETGMMLTAQNGRPAVMLQNEGRIRVALADGEGGGSVSAYGPTKEGSGMASLLGGRVAGSVSIATNDGTPQVTLDATDHGGRLLINNDLGFHRISMGVHQEAAGIHLNHTGSLGVQAVATPNGGFVGVSDAAGNLIDSMPLSDDDDDESSSWGRFPMGDN